jgi:hypothetical protein
MLPGIGFFVKGMSINIYGVSSLLSHSACGCLYQRADSSRFTVSGPAATAESGLSEKPNEVSMERKPSYPIPVNADK